MAIAGFLLLSTVLHALAGTPATATATSTDGAFSAANLDAIAAVIPPEIVADIVRRQIGDAIDTLTFEQTYSLPPHVVTAAQYVLLAARAARSRALAAAEAASGAA